MLNLFIRVIIAVGGSVIATICSCYLLERLSKSSKNIFICLYGASGSGKTTFLKNLKEEISDGQTLRSEDYELVFKFKGALGEEKIFSLKVRDTVGEKDHQTDEINKIKKEKGTYLRVLVFSDLTRYSEEPKYRRECNSTLRGVFSNIKSIEDCSVFFVFTHKDLLKSFDLDSEGKRALKKEFPELPSENIFSINATKISEAADVLKEVLKNLK